ncbi:cheR [Symbiodinium natans]|uniref:CheR protein n=1 Tax=Symbiodinium natans TaxID=878477 RepID=A0A812GQB5_9DINO|nr:cheR [Symbiodinium natans]
MCSGAARSQLYNLLLELRVLFRRGSLDLQEIYYLSMIWHRILAAIFPETGLQLLGTDLSEQKILTARKGEYPWYSLKDLPPEWCEQFFDSPANSWPRGLRPRAAARLQAARTFASQAGTEALYRVKDNGVRRDVEFLCQDVTAEMPEGPFDVILSRYAVCLYLPGDQRSQVLVQMVERLRPGGFLVIGGKDHLPNGFCDKHGLMEVDYRAHEIGLGDVRCIFQKSGGAPLDANLADRRGRAPSYSQYVRSLGSEPYWVAERRRLERQRLAVQMSQKSRDLLNQAVQEGRRLCDSPFDRESKTGTVKPSEPQHVERTPSMPKEEREVRLQSFLQRLEKDLAERGRRSLKAEIERLDCFIPGLLIPKSKSWKRKKKRKKRRKKKSREEPAPAAVEDPEDPEEEEDDDGIADLTPAEPNFDSVLFSPYASGSLQFF